MPLSNQQLIVSTNTEWIQHFYSTVYVRDKSIRICYLNLVEFIMRRGREWCLNKFSYIKMGIDAKMTNKNIFFLGKKWKIILFLTHWQFHTHMHVLYRSFFFDNCLTITFQFRWFHNDDRQKKCWCNRKHT